MTDNNTDPKPKKISYIGLGIPFGAAFGFIIGLLLFPDNFFIGVGLGVALGLIFGSALDAQQSKKKEE